MYLDNLNKELKNNNRSALRYGDGKAWDNRKRKTLKALHPRGNVAKRLEKLNEVKRANKFYQTLHQVSMEIESRRHA